MDVVTCERMDITTVGSRMHLPVNIINIIHN